MGVDFFKAKDFIENKGCYSLNHKVLRENLNNPNYYNPLRLVRQVYPQPETYQYQMSGPPFGAPLNRY